MLAIALKNCETAQEASICSRTLLWVMKESERRRREQAMMMEIRHSLRPA